MTLRDPSDFELRTQMREWKRRVLGIFEVRLALPPRLGPSRWRCSASVAIVRRRTSRHAEKDSAGPPWAGS